MSIRAYIALALWFLTFGVLLLDAHWAALWPSIVAVSTVFLVRRAITGLLAGATSAMILLHQGNPASAFVAFFSDHLLPSLQSSWNLSILIFTLLLGGFAAVVSKGGGINALLHRWIHNQRAGRRMLMASAYGLGLACFFDGLANSLLVGRTLQEPSRRLGISGEKLAYIVDSTSSAVACVAVMSTWIAYQLSMIREGFTLAGVEATSNPFHLFLQSIPYNFYCWFTLILLAVVILKDWNLGPMRLAEAEALNSGKPDDASESLSEAQVSHPAKSLRAIIPLLILTFGLLAGLYWDGTGGNLFPLHLSRVSEAFGKADAALVMLVVSSLACLTAVLLNAPSIRKQGVSVSATFMEGVQHLFQPICILISAWIFSSTLEPLQTVNVLAAILQGQFPNWLFPLVVFLTGALISFSSGTSWGTMGVLMPLALPLAIHLSNAPDGPLVIGTIAAVFSGAVFGDHCSPLSDTTIVSSISCGIEPFAHVRTQLPYALLAAFVAVMAGFLPTGLGAPAPASLLLGGALLVSLSFLFSRNQPSPHA